ncbi:hypothetical protein CRUP_000800 [Coryphaenoides rupestris]|nr:hypothetical protein CRUP_000800 [Coryphaenoides rupestris]
MMVIMELELDVEMRIIGGKDAWAHSWPWQVSLRYGTMSTCGGAIISPLWVISAAHCFLRLREPLRFNTYVRPIEIWMSPVQPSMSCTVTGWGSTRENGPRVNRLQEVNVTCLPLQDCKRFYKGRIHPSMFCAGKLEGGADACQGDSGGPLSCYTGERYQLAGVVSWGVGCGRVKRPGVYTKIQDHSDWISDVMSKGGPSCGEAETPHCRLSSLPATLAVSNDTGGGLRAGGVSLQSEGRHYCSGTLIHKRWVLAPHHCRAKVGDMVVLGVHDLRFMASQSVPVDEMRLLPSSISSCTLSLDVAISACAENTAHRKVSTVPPMAV